MAIYTPWNYSNIAPENGWVGRWNMSFLVLFSRPIFRSELLNFRSECSFCCLLFSRGPCFLIGGFNFQPIENWSSWWSSWWLNQPLWKIWSSNWILSPRIGEKNKKWLKPPPIFFRNNKIVVRDDSPSQAPDVFPHRLVTSWWVLKGANCHNSLVRGHGFFPHVSSDDQSTRVFRFFPVKDVLLKSTDC